MAEPHHRRVDETTTAGTTGPGFYPLLRRVNIYLRRWAGKKYRRLRTDKRLNGGGPGYSNESLGLFAQWQWVHSP